MAMPNQACPHPKMSVGLGAKSIAHGADDDMALLLRSTCRIVARSILPYYLYYFTFSPGILHRGDVDMALLLRSTCRIVARSLLSQMLPYYLYYFTFSPGIFCF